jgi:hypothetical protein
MTILGRHLAVRPGIGGGPLPSSLAPQVGRREGPVRVREPGDGPTWLWSMEDVVALIDARSTKISGEAIVG